MKSFTASNLAAIAEQSLMPRDFMSITVRDAVTDAPSTYHFWSGIGDKTALVYNPDTGSNENRTFKGAGQLIEIAPIAHVANLTVQDITVTMSALLSDVNDSFRLYNARQGVLEIWRGFLDAADMDLVDAAEPHFFGAIDRIEVNTGKEGEPSLVIAHCKSILQQLVRFNPETRSDASQKLRNATDDFYKYTASVGEWEQFWGTKKGKLVG